MNFFRLRAYCYGHGCLSNFWEFARSVTCAFTPLSAALKYGCAGPQAVSLLGSDCENAPLFRCDLVGFLVLQA